jgi:hypothetical protein
VAAQYRVLRAALLRLAHLPRLRRVRASLPAAARPEAVSVVELAAELVPLPAVVLAAEVRAPPAH